MRRGTRLLVSMVLALLVLYGAIGLIQYRQYQALSQVVQSGDRGLQGGFAQFQVEYQRLGNALNQRMFEPLGMSMEDLLVRYEVFVSRVIMLGASDGSDADSVRHGLQGGRARVVPHGFLPWAGPHSLAALQQPDS